MNLAQDSNATMNCLEFKRIALSDPSSNEESFIRHRDSCPNCLKYVGELRQMDAQLADSLDVEIPSDLAAKLLFHTEMDYEKKSKSKQVYALAASLAVVFLVAAFLISNQFTNQQVEQDYQQLLSAVVEHVEEEPFTPVWEVQKAHDTVNVLLASYDTPLRLHQLESLTFGRICPLGRYRGLHATLDSGNGQTTFFYIKGESIGDVLDTSYQGYATRIKPVKDGNLIIVSRTQQSLHQADQALKKAMVWDI